MKGKIILSKLFLIDLEAIVEHYYPLNRRTAQRYYDGIIKSVQRLPDFPEIGRIVPEFEEEFYDKYREIIYEFYRIIYRIESQKILISRIIDSRRLLNFNIIRDVF